MEKHFSRIATAIGKFWITKRAVVVVAEALECLGGNGYVETAPMARLYRDAPLNSIWEGSGNVQCLDVLRAMRKEPETVEALYHELRKAKGADNRYDNFVAKIEKDFADENQLEFRARSLVEDLGIALQAAILLQHGNQAVKDAFCASRLSGNQRSVLGTLPAGVETKSIIERALPILK